MSTNHKASMQQTWFFELSEDELSYVLLLLEVSLIPGLEANSISRKPQAEKEMVVDIVQRALLAKGYALLGDNGVWELEATFADLIRLLVKPAYVFTMVVLPGRIAPPSVTICFASPGIVIAQSFPYPYSHRFVVLFSIPDYAADIKELLPVHESGVQSSSIRLPKSTVRDLLESSANDPQMLPSLGNGSPQREPHEIVAIQNTLVQREFSVLLTLSSMILDTLTSQQLSIVVSKNGYGLLFDDDPLRQDGDVRIELMPITQVLDSVRTWLMPLSSVNELG